MTAQATIERKIELEEDIQIPIEMPTELFIEPDMTYEDIDVSALESLTITDLRNLAFTIGITFPMSKDSNELVSEIRQKVETEMAYAEYPCF